MATTDVSLQEIEAAVKRLPANRRREVLLFIEFLEYLTSNYPEEGVTDDADLWNAVLAHQAYRKAHQDETPASFDSPDAFLRAMADF
jgi:hypothetical protein